MMTNSNTGTDLLSIFTHHKVAATLLMIIMILIGLFALDRLNVQFFPNFELDMVRVSVIWTGASAEDIEDGITNPLEQRLRSVENLHKILSTSSQGISTISLEFKEGTNPLLALDHTRRLVDEQRTLPADSEKPQIMSVTRYETVARLLITGVDDIAQLRPWVRRFEDELLQHGLDRVEITGLPEEEIAIQIDPLKAKQLGLSMDQIGDRVAAISRDQPAGILGRTESSRELRSLDQRRTVLDFASIPLITADGLRLTLGDVATITRRPREGNLLISVNDTPAIELSVLRSEDGNTLKSAKLLQDWLDATLPTLPPGINVRVYDEKWQLVRDRIYLLLSNGVGGLVLVVIILYLFLNGRVAFWVSMGIPTSFLGTMFVLWLIGGSINMISLFALIMALGIIVDDAIVVGEDAFAHYQMGESAPGSAEGGALRMLAPVMASSLSTVAAFLPLMLVGGRMGKILFEIPMVIVCVMIVSLIECFLILPNHLKHAFEHMHNKAPGAMRMRLEQGFDYFRDYIFRPFARGAITFRWITISLTIAGLISTMGLMAGGRIGFNFFPSPEASMLHANVSFVAGTPRATVDKFLTHLNITLRQAEQSFNQGQLVYAAIMQSGSGSGKEGGGSKGDNIGSIRIELTPSDKRLVRNTAIIKTWMRLIKLPAGVENFSIAGQRVGPPGKDVTVRLNGPSAIKLKEAATALEASLSTIDGVFSIENDMAFGREQLIYALSPAGEAEGLTIAELGRQLRAAFDGRLVQIFQSGREELEVRVTLPEQERGNTAILDHLNIRLPSGEQVPLNTVAKWDSRRGFEVLRHAEAQLAVEVMADVDDSRTSADAVMARLQQSDMLPRLATDYGIRYSFEGRSADQRETMDDMRKGLILGIILIYLVLAWVFSSYGWPLVVMATIPFGLVGALLGHWIMGIKLTILSIFGLFGLSGIAVNDSIVLVSFYQSLKDSGMSIREALEEATCQRLRAVLLTSLTTIGGLAPLLMETSLQAQFLIPMATSMAFGLAVTTFLVLLFVPSLLSIYEDIAQWFCNLRQAKPIESDPNILLLEHTIESS